MARFVVGVTGGVASGKSAVTALFQALGVEVVDADLAAREVVAPGQPALAEIARRFGPDLLLANGMLNRMRMRDLVFEDAKARKVLESITHPRIRDVLRKRCANAGGLYVVAAIPLLAEAKEHNYAWLDRRLIIDCPPDAQLSRLVSRNNIEPGLAKRIISSQCSREERLIIATDVLINDGRLDELAKPVRRLDARFSELALKLHDAR